MVLHTSNSNTWEEMQVNLYALEASLVYTVSSRIQSYVERPCL